MPLTPLQQEIFKFIAINRNPDSYAAGASVIHRDSGSTRYSDDIDIFHDTTAALALSANLDIAALKSAGYEVEVSFESDTFRRAVVRRDGHVIRLEWAADSAFRFFPVVPDETLGYRLHDADAATNKVLAAAGRDKVRDFIDLIYLDGNYISLGVAVWAAAGKDEGYTPELIVDQMRRHSKINPATVGDVILAKPADAVALKQQWLKCLRDAETLIASLPSKSLGCLYLDRTGQPARGEVFDPSWVPHYGSVKGAWPKLSE